MLSVASELHVHEAGRLPDRGRAVDRRALAGLAARSGRRRGCTRSPRRHSPAGAANGDALVCGDDPDAKELALALAGKVVTGRALDAGPLASARALEGMTAVIVNLNRRYKGHAGVRVVGLP